MDKVGHRDKVLRPWTRRPRTDSNFTNGVFLSLVLVIWPAHSRKPVDQPQLVPEAIIMTAEKFIC